jgi:glycine/D-amino acid oxidase-like deaminating enzyme
MKAPKGDIAIVGGGILGVVLANEAVAAGFRPVVFRLSDAEVPFADSFRNQAWLQSGLRYIRHNAPLALRMWTYGRRLHEVIGVPVPSGRGVFQLHSEADVTSFLEDAQRLGIANEVEELGPDEAQRLLGPHYESGRHFYSTPESPFDEAKLIRQARDQAELRDATFCEIPKPVEIMPCAGRSPSHRLRVDGKEMEFAATILAAGAGNIPLVESLGEQVRIRIVQTPLLVLPGPPTIEAPIFIDRSSGFSLVAHPPGRGRSDGCMVFAAAVNEPVDSHCLPSAREVNPGKRKELRDAVPEPLKSRLHQSRITAGWELSVIRHGHEQHTAEPFIETAQHHDDIIIAMPGRATLALYAAERVMEKLRRLIKSARRVETSLASSWNPSSIRMHHEEYYDKRLND